MHKYTLTADIFLQIQYFISIKLQSYSLAPATLRTCTACVLGTSLHQFITKQIESESQTIIL